MPDPWPRSARWTSAGLEVGGLAAADLAERFGTPLLVIDEADLRERMRATAAVFPRVAYAVKAMTCAAVIRQRPSASCHTCVCSPVPPPS